MRTFPVTQRRNQNSILVLATLGVYLGLVLAGATPQVLAQAAMTREFRVKDEIEAKDNLDKNPDKNELELARSLRTYLAELDGYLNEVVRADRSLGSVFTRNPEKVITVPCHEVEDSDSLLSGKRSGFTSLPILLDPFHLQHNYNTTWTVKCRPLYTNSVESVRYAEIAVSWTREHFQYQLSVGRSPVAALDLFENLRRTFLLVLLADLSSRQKVLWQNTRFRQDGETVLVVTRLPRANLDSLLTDAQ